MPARKSTRLKWSVWLGSSNRSELLRADTVSSERAGLGSVAYNLGYSGLAQQNGIWLAFSGTLFDTSRLDGGLGSVRELEESSSGQAPAELLLQMFLRGGIEFLTGLNGGFTLAVWDGPNRRLYLMNDRVGNRPIYFWQTPNRIMFSGEYKAISGHPAFPKTIDPAAVADLFHYRTVVGGRTLFRVIRALPPAALAVFEGGQFHVGKYWSPGYFPAGQPVRTDAEYADDLADLLQQAVQRRVKPNTCLLITGGLDSRTVAGFYRLIAPQVPLQAVTLGVATGQDVVIGQEIARVLGLPFTRIPIDETYYQQYAAQAAWQAELRIEAYASWILAAVPYLKANGYQYALTGLYGNLVSGRNIPREFLQVKTLEGGLRIVEKLVQGEHSGLERVMRPEMLKEASQESFRFFPEVFLASDAPDLIYKFDLVALAHNITRHGNTGDALGDVSIPLDPFTDIDVIGFTFEGIPSRVRARALFYSEMIVRRLGKRCPRSGSTRRVFGPDGFMDQPEPNHRFAG